MNSSSIKYKGGDARAELAETAKDIEKLKTVIIGIIKVLGLYDEQTGTIKESIAKGEESYIKPILKSLGKLISGLTFNKDQIAKDFAFIELIFPILKKYAGSGI